MKTSREGLDLIKGFEGLELVAYEDAAGVLTIGYGHTSMAGPPLVTEGMIITEQEANDMLVRDVVKYEQAVTRYLTRAPTQHEFDAMVSLCYNIGPDNFSRSSVLKYFNAGDKGQAAASFALWNKAGGKVLKGLVTRRAAEAKHFRTPDTAVPPPVAPPIPPDVEPPVAPPQGPPAAPYRPSLQTVMVGIMTAVAAGVVGLLSQCSGG